MAPVSYSFNANKPSYRSKKSDGTKRRFFIFICLLAFFGAVIYFVFGDNDSSTEIKTETSKEQNPPMVSAPEKAKNIPKTSAQNTPKTSLVPKTETKAAPVEKIVEAVPEKAVDHRNFPKMEALCEQAESALAKGNYKKVRELCYQILDSRTVPDHNPLWERTVKVLGYANVKILFSDYPLPGKKVNYHVKPNDGLRKIAMDHNTSIETVQRSNNMKLTDFNVQLGKTFNIYAGSWKIIISKSRKKLYLFDGSKLFKVYEVGIGKQDRTPTGVFLTGGKRKNPDWYSPAGKIPFGEKGNVLGTRWIRLNPNGKCSREVSGLGIHGTWDPDSIGKAKSNGCLRMHNKDVEELFAILPNANKPVSVTIIK
jgi:lipoprotein-anchoring transpeptidase ErfK/SrfK